jgi:hypothetical protein
MATQINITESPPESVSDLISLHNRLTEFVDVGAFSGATIDQICLTAGAVRFDIAKAPARTAQEIAAKALFFIRDYVDVGPCDEFADAMRAGLRADHQRLGGAA